MLFLRTFAVFLQFAGVFLLAGPALAGTGFGRPSSDETQAVPPAVENRLQKIGIVEKLGAQVSINNLTFRDENGKVVQLADYFRTGHPVLLNLVYYECPHLCTFVLNGLVASLKNLKSWAPGEQFDIVSVSIDPLETPKLATQKKAAYLSSLGNTKAAEGWHFLTGDKDQIQKLADEVGFGFEYDPEVKQYAHGAVIFVLTPTGKISRYLYGVEYKQQDLKLALLEASQGKIGNIIDRFLLFCYRYDPHTRKYSVYVSQLMAAGCGSTVVILGVYLFRFWRRQRKESKST
jgi:protein SCO1/2